MKILNLSNKVIEFSFYGLFFLTPLVFSSRTSELYELNKMWLVFVLAILIAAAWGTKTIVLKKFYLQKTPLDIPILIFLASQIISTVISLDSYVSFWGYYSRFNGGLASTISYIFLYYAFLSNFSLARGGEKEGFPTARTSVNRERALAGGNSTTGPRAIEMVKKLLIISLVSASVVVLWGLPSHFGFDPTCYLFKGTFDVSCWTSDFQPKIRIFSTLGQPDWLGAYLAVLTPLLIAFFLNAKNKLYAICSMLFAVLFYLALLFTKSRSALLGFWVAIAVFGLLLVLKNASFAYFWYELKGKLKLPDKKFIIHHSSFIILIAVLLAATLLITFPFNNKSNQTGQQVGTFSTGGGGTESGKIRLYVWQGGLTAWIHNPIIGTGVETFAFAYYKYKPIGHNLTSEWNYLYNKAHNEYLNFLTTSGIFGLGSYLAIIGTFLFYVIRMYTNRNIPNLFEYIRTNIIRMDSHEKGSLPEPRRILVAGLIAGYISILVTNFFGFSVVIINIYFFLIPALVFILLGTLNSKKVFIHSFDKKNSSDSLSILQKLDIFVVLLTAGYLLLFLGNFWLADQAYSLGGNLTRAGEYTNSYYKLKEAVARVGFEPAYKDELASNDAIFAVSLLSQKVNDKDKAKIITFAQDVAREGISYAEENSIHHPNNLTFWKTKVRIYYILSQINQDYAKDALNALKKAQTLAPTDANIYYNLGLLYGQNGDTKKAVESLKEAIRVKSNYKEAYYALGLFYRQMATDKSGKVVDFELNNKAIEQMKIVLRIDPKNNEAKTALEAFSK